MKNSSCFYEKQRKPDFNRLLSSISKLRKTLSARTYFPATFSLLWLSMNWSRWTVWGWKEWFILETKRYSVVLCKYNETICFCKNSMSWQKKRRIYRSGTSSFAQATVECKWHGSSACMPSWPLPHQKNTPPGNITSKGNDNKTPLMLNMYVSKICCAQGASILSLSNQLYSRPPSW